MTQHQADHVELPPPSWLDALTSKYATIESGRALASPEAEAHLRDELAAHLTGDPPREPWRAQLPDWIATYCMMPPSGKPRLPAAIVHELPACARRHPIR